MKSPGKIILVRHGETSFNKKGESGSSAERIRGWMDIPLDKDGERQAQEAALRLSDEPLQYVYTSPLLRARETGRSIAKANGVPMALDRALLPWNVGQFQGKYVKDVLPEMKRLASKENQDESAPGGEAFSTFRERFLGYLQHMLGRCKRDGKTYALVAHTRNTQMAKAWDKAGRPADLDYDEGAMNDYGKETGTGDDMVLRP